ncbi:unnamed protein product [Colletotrichum noveboracense]|uniref:Uncharacterized protein n=1 Tax=Colletotrichum noveboracense TaxID=2664923 RepID=A0A9W4WFL5_9PEZI|nr:unnamed protein product [Colletotrichum noveboracense]
MQFFTLLVVLFAGIVVATPAVVERQQNTVCISCRDDCFRSKGSDANFKKCLNTCNKDLGCTLSR